MRQLLHLRRAWRRQEARLERAVLGAGMSLVAVIAEFVLSRRLRR